MRRSKAQTTIVMLVIVIMVFGGIVTFLLTLAGTVSQREYMNLYVHNMLLTTLRTDTGYLDSNCRTVSDTITCAFLNPGWVCEGSGTTCKGLAQSLLAGYADRFDTIRKNYLYLFTVEPEGFSVRDPDTGDLMKIEVGNLDPSARVEALTANERIVKEGNIFKAQLRIAAAEQPDEG
jgi:hypothetical protein